MSNRRNRIDRPSAPSTEVPRHEIVETRGVMLHRITCGDTLGAWHTYQQIATLKTATQELKAATDYYHGTLPTNRVFVVSEIT